MKNSILKITLLTNLSLVAIGYAGMTSAHDQGGALGDDGSVVDLYQVTCSTDSGGDSDHLEIQVIDPNTVIGGGKISAVVKKGGLVLNTSDKVRADTEFSPLISMSGGNGSYEVMVHKLKTGTKNYLLTYHCKSSTGNHTGTSLITLQNQ